MPNMSTRKLDSISMQQTNIHFENYDSVAYFVEKTGYFPNNTVFVSNSVAKGVISYTLLYNTLLAAGAKILFKSSSYELGVRKIYFELDNVFFTVDNIHYKKRDAFTGIPDTIDSVRGNMISIVGSLTIMHETEDMPDYAKELIDQTFLKPVERPTVGIISRESTGFFLSDVTLEDSNVDSDLCLHYGEDFPEFHQRLMDKINSCNHGLTLLHGEPGSGKSTYIKRLIYDLKKTNDKKIIIVPNNIVPSLLEPEFNTFLLEMVNDYDTEEYDPEYMSDAELSEAFGETKGVIMILEEAESVLMKRDSYGTDQGTSNILNLTSGLLNDIFGIQIIATYNTEDHNIDPAIQRSKRMIAKRYFGKLNLDQTVRLAGHVGVPQTPDEPMTVADVYAMLDEEENNILIDTGKAKKKNNTFGID